LRAAGVEVETGLLASEARVVLGPWLTVLQKQRPLIIWSYMVSDDQTTALPGDTAEAAVLRSNADAVMREDGTVAEAVPGRHGAGILDLTKTAVHAGPDVIASSLYAGGVRCLLLDGGLAVAAPFLAANLVDSLVAYLPDGSASAKPSSDVAGTFMPPGFAITGACKSGSFTRIEAQPDISYLADEASSA
jgi:diaminohydroxyphosphoribosylaminopyrimidine deaminase / 5-amino-6-(5-phosphoribosylamino)uracil reductase